MRGCLTVVWMCVSLMTSRWNIFLCPSWPFTYLLWSNVWSSHLLTFELSPWFSGWWLSGKESACQCPISRFCPWVGKIPWRRKWQPTPISFSGKSHGQRSLVGYSPWGHKKLNMINNMNNSNAFWNLTPDYNLKMFPILCVAFSLWW